MTDAGRLRSLTGDLAALGRGAPVRAAYEASKRAGGHRIVFGGLTKIPPPRRPADRWHRGGADLLSLAPTVAERARSAAAPIADGRVPVFGTTVEVDPRPDWHAVLDGSGRSWPTDPWWLIDIRSAERLGDVKLSWELNRQRHVVVLARATAVEPAGPWRAALEAHLDSWLEANPPEHGVQWYSNLEIALRSFVWIEALDLAASHLPAPLVRRLHDALVHGGRHLVADLPYTLSTMRNNHLLGDALALEVLAARGLAGRRAASVGRRLFAAQLDRHMRADGSMIEDSLSYHRFVLEMLVLRDHHGLADATTRDAMIDAAQYLARLGVLDGPVPQYGDWDEGRVLVAAGPPDDLRGTVLAALARGGTGADPDHVDQHDEVAWYTRAGEPLAPQPAERDGHDIGSGIARSTRGPWTSWLKAGGGPSHGHADRCSTPILHRGRWLVGDPGTGTYNGPIAERNHFRTSVAHSVLRIDDEDQLVPHRAFRWSATADGVVGPPSHHGDLVVSWGAHDAYRRIGAGRVVRAVVTGPGGVVVADWVEAGRGRRWALSLPLGPDVELVEDPTDLLRTPDGDVPVHLPGSVTWRRASTEPFDGWWSDTYDQRRPSTRVEATGSVAGPVVWAVGELAPTVGDDHRVTVGDLTLAVHWHGARIELGSGGSSLVSTYLELP